MKCTTFVVEISYCSWVIGKQEMKRYYCETERSICLIAGMCFKCLLNASYLPTTLKQIARKYTVIKLFSDIYLSLTSFQIVYVPATEGC